MEFSRCRARVVEIVIVRAGGGRGLAAIERASELTLVLLVGGDLLGNGLHLQQQLDALDGRDGRLGDGRRNASGDEILGEGHGVRDRRVHGVGCWFFLLVVEERARLQLGDTLPAASV